ncbi:glomulin, FKBP associated protein b [Clupea harengus]|uniref:Glomulin, FKBP associated protein b n=1 Tax=Clupea harengus TaxID=7950 RepID=A0A6P8G6K2_CLUHA|nr:glomulin, FKBP associated protein b [Clupea harengus]
MPKFQDVVQKWRNTPAHKFRQKDRELCIQIGSACIDQGETAKVLDFIKEEQNQGIVKALGLGLLQSLVRDIVKRRRNPVHCEAAVSHLVQTCKPKDLFDNLFGQLEDCDPGAIGETVICLLPLLQTVLLRLGGGKGPCVGAVLEAAQKQVSRLPVPYTRQQEKVDVHCLSRCCTALLDFIQPFVEEVKKGDSKKGGPSAAANDGLRADIVKFCMMGLREPLLQAVLQGPNSSFWTFATGIMVILPAIQKPLPVLLFYQPMGKGEEPISKAASYSVESRACLAYLLFVQLIAMETFPAIFCPVFVLQCNMDYVKLLFTRKDESWLTKGLDLCEKSLERVEDSSLPVEILELRAFYTVPQNLVEIMTVCPIKHLKTKGLHVFQLFIDKLNGEAKHRFFRCMLKTSRHAGVEGLVIKNTKNQVDPAKCGKVSCWFSGEHLLSLLQLILSLPQGPQTDLLQGMDRVMESLNLLRFLLIKEKEQSSSKSMWAELCKLSDSYRKVLRVCLSLSRTYYGSELKTLRENQKNKAKERREALKLKKPVREINVRDEKLSNMSAVEQHQVLQCAMVTFDLMDSLVVRIEELMEDRAM